MSELATDVATIVDTARGTTETIRYIDANDGAQLYTVLHHAKGEPRGALLLCGPVNAERERGLRTLVDIARTVAGRGITVLRFDYRGMGESTGTFSEYTFTDWISDIERSAAYLAEVAPAVPRGVWGVRGGALLASAFFASGSFDAAMFCAPMDGHALLQDILRRTLVADMMARPHAKRTTREEIIAALERGETMQVDGYPWTARLWRDAASHRFVVPRGSSKPWRVVDFRGIPKAAIPSEEETHRDSETSERFWESMPLLVPRTSSVVDRTLAWTTTFINDHRPGGASPCIDGR